MCHKLCSPLHSTQCREGWSHSLAAAKRRGSRLFTAKCTPLNKQNSAHTSNSYSSRYWCVDLLYQRQRMPCSMILRYSSLQRGGKGEPPSDLFMRQMEAGQHMGDGCGFQSFKHQAVVFPTSKCILQKKKTNTRH